MKLQYRVLLSQLPALLILLLMAVAGGATVTGLAEQGRDVQRDNYRSVVAAQRMKEAVERLDSAALFRLAGSPQNAEAMVAKYLPAFEAELQAAEGNITELGEAEVMAQLRQRWLRYQASYQHFLAAPPETAHSLYFSTLFPDFSAVNENANQVLDINQDAMVRKAEEASKRGDLARRAWYLWSCVAVGSAVALGTVLSRRIAGPLRVVSESAKRIGEGNLEVRLSTSRVDELDSLVEAFNEMADRLRLYRRAADSELARAREAAQAAIESLADPVLVLTVRGEIRASNGAARRTLGIDPRSRRLDRCDPELLNAVETVRASVVKTGRAALPADFASVVDTETPKGPLAFLPHATPINDAVSGELVGVTVLLQDVTRFRRLDELKGNLVNTVAHELRTPLTSLGMALHLALDERVSGTLSPKLLELLTAAREDSGRLRALVEDLLDLSRIQGGQLVLQAEPVAALDLLSEVREVIAGQAESYGIAIHVEAGPKLDNITVDRARIVIALTNFAVNAIRHAPADTTVVLRAVPGDRCTRLEVDDAGRGVSLAQRERIFEPFIQGEGEESRGAGLGLYIAQQIALAHGGRIGVGQSAAGGAQFWIEIPST